MTATLDPGRAGAHPDAWLVEMLDRLDDLLDVAVAVARPDGLWTLAADGAHGPVEDAELESLVVTLALAPELDSAYGRVYASLQGDASCRLPTVGLVLDLLCGTREERVRLLPHLAPDGPLYDGGLVDLASPTGDGRLAAREVRLTAWARRRLLGEQGLDPRLDGLATLVRPTGSLGSLPLDPAPALALAQQADALAAGRLRLQLVGPDERLAARVAHALAAEAGRTVVDVDARAFPDPAVAELVGREAQAEDALLHVRGGPALDDAWVSFVERRPLAVITSTRPSQALLVAGFPVIELGLPAAAIRAACWVEAAAAVGCDLAEEDAEDLATSYQLGVTEIGDATRVAAVRRSLEAVPVAGPADFRRAASELAARGVAAVARRVEICHGWDDLVLADDARSQLEELSSRMRHRERVLDEWHLRRGASAGFGTHALFSGPSGTGKTAAAQVVAGDLGFQLWKVDLACVVSKYIGETEKNLDAIFGAAAGSDVVLLFDEADALFGKRSEVRDAHDRYANIEISYLLQRMEEHEGVTILATNLRHNLDEAFLRRLAFDVQFPFPDQPQRLAIWERSFPDEVPLGPDVDLAALAERFTLSGGQIRNVAVAAAYLAAAADEALSQDHLHRAVRREFQKLGKDIEVPARGQQP